MRLWPRRDKTPPVVRTYESENDFHFDQHLMRADGWHVASSWKSPDGRSRVVWVRSVHRHKHE